MKKFTALILALLVGASLLTACSPYAAPYNYNSLLKTYPTQRYTGTTRIPTSS